ncbi:glycine/D-amino acid oxidase-like deaminating enzyme [Streptomyces sp. V4I23]|uniref:FAD-dependent oxidoreductase n=1 Tax=Streptomyces sp. V4I23 TaxID=3042282 RepID=UPI002786EDAE|nr:FAD-dependent oxidoreductase [Streptomyces sp. V4I23]MDQ1012995.1 glycine/D-amino acid oxidase-like deaminating enzyme [Streptomyces sp. V4I23]
MTQHTDVVVVGGGQAGLATGYHLRRQALDFVVLDTESAPGGAWQHTWDSLPRYLADDIDGRVLFDVATARRRALDAGRTDTGGVASLGNIVAVPPVREARDAGLLQAKPMFTQLTATGVKWADGTQAEADTVIWCTGFRPALAHLAPLGLRGARGRIATDGTRAVAEPRLHLVGYGDWTGPASATLIGVGRPARDAAREVAALLAD